MGRIFLIAALIVTTGTSIFFCLETFSLSNRNSDLSKEMDSLRHENSALSSRLITASNVIVSITNAAATQIKSLQTELNFPIEVKYRKALTGNGYVTQFVNTSEKIVHFTVELSNSDNRRSFSRTLDPKKISEIGYAEGWAGSPGDSIVVTAGEYGSVTKHLP